MPADIIIGSGLFVKTRAAGKGNDSFGTVPTGIRPGTGVVSLSPSDYTKVYVADLGPGSGSNTRVIAIVPKSPALPGASYNVTVTIAGNDDASNAPLAPKVLIVEVDGPTPPPPQATEMDYFALTDNTEHGTVSAALADAPADPGTPSITF